MNTIDVEAVTCVLASDAVWRDPGDRWACPAGEADGLLAHGAVRRVEPAPADGPEAPAGDPEAPNDLVRVSGIGPSTAAALAAAGVETLAALAALTDGQIAALDVDEGVRRRIRGDWRDQARVLTGRNPVAPETPAS